MSDRPDTKVVSHFSEYLPDGVEFALQHGEKGYDTQSPLFNKHAAKGADKPIKLRRASGPPGKAIVKVDFDDHDGTANLNELTQFLKDMELNRDTFTLKTPRGNGYHLFFLADREIVDAVGKPKLTSSKYPHIEVLLGLSWQKWFDHMPGGWKKEGEYTLFKAAPFSPISAVLERDFKKRALARREFEQEKKIQFNVDAKEDTLTNKNKATEFLIKYAMSHEKAQVGAHDETLWRACADMAQHNLSIGAITEIVCRVAPLLIDPWSGEVDWVRQKAESAYKNVREDERHQNKSVDEVMAPWPRDSRGFLNVSYDQLIERVSSWYTLSNRLSNMDRVTAFTEMLIIEKSVVYIPNKIPEEIFESKYRLETTLEEPDVGLLADYFRETTLFWSRANVRDFKQDYITNLPENRGRSIPVANLAVFNRQREINYVSKENKLPKKLFVNGNAYLGQPDSLFLAHDEWTKEDKRGLDNLLDFFAKNLTDTTYPEEWEFVLDRFAILIQNHGVPVPHIPIFKGMQNRGKSFWLTLMRSLLPKGTHKTYNTVEDLGDFSKPYYFNIVNEAPHQIADEKIWEAIKSKVAERVQHVNEKYIQEYDTEQLVNFAMATNYDITTTKMLEDRRVTIFEGADPYSEVETHSRTIDIAKFLIGHEEDKLRGLRILYSFFKTRVVKRKQWTYKTRYQLGLVSMQYKESDQSKALVNLILNLGFTTHTAVYPLSHAEHIKARNLDSKQFIINRYDLVYYFMHMLAEEEPFKRQPASKHGGNRLKSWMNQHPTTRYMYESRIDPQGKKCAAFMTDTASTFTTLFPPLIEIIDKLDTEIEIGDLYEWKDFILTEPTREDAKRFLETKYPGIKPGTITLNALRADNSTD